MITPTNPVRRRTSTNNGRPRAQALAPVAGAALCVCLACGAGNVRPFYGPLPAAASDTIAGEPARLILELERLAAVEGLRVARASPEEGYLETDWYDVDARRPGGRYTLHPRRIVRLRFFADDVGGGKTALASEAVYRRSIDPSVPVRETEVMAPADHPGAEILERLLDAVRRAR